MTRKASCRRWSFMILSRPGGAVGGPRPFRSESGPMRGPGPPEQLPLTSPGAAGVASPGAEASVRHPRISRPDVRIPHDSLFPTKDVCVALRSCFGPGTVLLRLSTQYWVRMSATITCASMMAASRFRDRAHFQSLVHSVLVFETR